MGFTSHFACNLKIMIIPHENELSIILQNPRGWSMIFSHPQSNFNIGRRGDVQSKIQWSWLFDLHQEQL